MSDLFEEIVAGVPQPSVWQTAFGIEEEYLQAERPGGYEVEEIGHRTWERLSEEDRETALPELFYAAWENRQQQLDDRARWEREGSLKKELQPLLARYGELTKAGTPVPPVLAASIAQLTFRLMVPCDPSCECPACSSKPGGAA